MNKSLFVGLSLLVIALSVQIVSAINCFQCNSKFDPGCDTTPVNTKYLKECSDRKDGSKYDRCRKLDQWVDKEMEGLKPNKRVIRDCGFDQGTEERQCYYRAGFGGRQNVCTCKEDDCNHASKLGSAIFGIVACLAISIFNIVH